MPIMVYQNTYNLKGQSKFMLRVFEVKPLICNAIDTHKSTHSCTYITYIH